MMLYTLLYIRTASIAEIFILELFTSFHFLLSSLSLTGDLFSSSPFPESYDYKFQSEPKTAITRETSMTGRQTTELVKHDVCLTLDDVARKLTRISRSLNSIANFVNEEIEGRPGFFDKFRRAAENHSANAQAIWRFHDKRWGTKVRADGTHGDEDEDTSDEADDRQIDEEVDRRTGHPFTFARAVGITLEYIGMAENIMRERKSEMERWADEEGARLLEAFLEAYERESRNWTIVREHLERCTTYKGESTIDTSLRHGWL